jgi:hypothetical protein
MYCVVLGALLQVTIQIIQIQTAAAFLLLSPSYFAFFSLMQMRPGVYAYTSALFYVHIYILTF